MAFDLRGTGFGAPPNPFQISFTSMKMRYQDYDKTLDELGFIQPGDSVNVFINFESVLGNLAMVRDIENKLLLERNFPRILEAESINLCAHYRRFFRDNELDTRVYLYYTDMMSKHFPQFQWNDEYRSYYINKYLQNPKFQLLGNKLVDTVIPRVQKILEFCPGSYFIKANGFDGSLIPLIIARNDLNRKNLIVTCERFDTQYLLKNKEFILHYIHKSPQGTTIQYKLNDYLSVLFKENMEAYSDTKLFSNPSFYSLLLSSIGDKHRSVDPLKGIGCKTLMKLITTSIEKGLVSPTTTSISMLKNIFSEELQEQAVENFHCIDLDDQYSQLTQQNIFDTMSQVVDRSDLNSLQQLNMTDYLSYPLMLPELTC